MTGEIVFDSRHRSLWPRGPHQSGLKSNRIALRDLLPRKIAREKANCPRTAIKDYRLLSVCLLANGRRSRRGMRALYRKLGIGLSLLMAYQTEKASIRARTFRKSETTAEKRLWEELRGSRLNGFKFVRHLPIGPYFADFACRSVKLIVEVDGATHGNAHELAYDAKRSLFLNEQGWAVHRITVIPAV